MRILIQHESTLPESGGIKQVVATLHVFRDNSLLLLNKTIASQDRDWTAKGRHGRFRLPDVIRRITALVHQ